MANGLSSMRWASAMKRTVMIGACLFPAFILINFFELNYWFYNNEMPAYMRGGVSMRSGGEAADAVKLFYEAARDACRTSHAKIVDECQYYQLGLLAHPSYVRPVASTAGFLLTTAVSSFEFMQALKFAIIGLVMASSLLCAILLLPFLAAFETRALTATALVFTCGWVGTRLLHVEGLGQGIRLVVFVLIAAALAFVVSRRVSLTKIKSFFKPRWSAVADFNIGSILSLVAIILCFVIGYRVHLIFESQFPLAYLLVAAGLWLPLHFALPEPKNWLLTGILVASLYLMATLVPAFFDLSLAKQHQLSLVGLLIFIAIWRDDARVYWALLFILLFDMQNAPRICAVILVAECLVGILRRQMPIGVVPVLLTAIIGFVVAKTTVQYPFGDRLFSIPDAIGVLLTPQVLASGFVASLLIWNVAFSRLRAPSGAPALDRMFIYAASVVVMAGIQIPTYGLVFDAFQLSNLYRGVATAPTFAIFSTVVALLLQAYRRREDRRGESNAIVSLAAVLLLLSSTKGRTISLNQLNEGIRASISSAIPPHWPRHTPVITMNDNIVYIDIENSMTSALMQYSIIKILLLSRSPTFSSGKLDIRSFDPVANLCNGSPCR